MSNSEYRRQPTALDREIAYVDTPIVTPGCSTIVVSAAPGPLTGTVLTAGTRWRVSLLAKATAGHAQ